MLILTVIILGYIVTQFAGYVIHRSMHWSRTGRIYRSHQIHHWSLYPPEDFLSDEKYRPVPKKDRPIWIYLFSILITSIILFFTLPIWITGILMIEMIAVALMNDWLHTCIHIRGHWMERFGLFMRLRALHRAHHTHTWHNLGIVSFIPDRVLGTFEDVQSNSST